MKVLNIALSHFGLAPPPDTKTLLRPWYKYRILRSVVCFRQKVGDNSELQIGVDTSPTQAELKRQSFRPCFDELLSKESCDNLVKYYREKHPGKHFADSKKILDSGKKYEIFQLVLKLHHDAINVIVNPTVDLYKYALEINGLVLKFITDKTPDMCLIAVKNNGEALKFIDNQTEELKLLK